MANITVRKGSKRFGGFTAVADLDLDVRDREFLILLGPSGCGKTTTLRSIAGLEHLDEGDILIDGKRVNDLRASDRDIAMVFQMYALYPHFNVHDNIAFPLKTQGASRAEIKARVGEVAEILRIGDILGKQPGGLSAGDRQRVALARAMVRRPKAFLMDEPLGSLDSKFREEMRAELKKLHLRIEATTVYVTHDQLEAMSMGDRIAIMRGGVLQQLATPHVIYEKPANLFVAGFIGAPGMNLVPGRLHRDGGGLKLLIGDQDWAVPEGPLAKVLDQAAGLPDNKVILGIRPENLVAEGAGGGAGQGSLSGKVATVEPMGPYSLIAADCGGVLFRLRTGRGVPLREGARLAFRPVLEKVRFFHPDSGRSLGEAA